MGSHTVIMGEVDDESTPMPIAELLHNARFLTNNLGVQIDVVIPMTSGRSETIGRGAGFIRILSR